MKRKGISSGDLAIYIVMVSIILMAAWPSVTGYFDRGNRSKAIGDCTMIASALSTYHQQMGTYPPNLEALTGASPYGPPWLLRLPAADPWGTTNAGIDGGGGTSAYAYAYTANGFAVWSLGKNNVNNSGGSGTALPAAFSGDDVGLFGQ